MSEAQAVGTIVLVGFMGSGKSTVARQLARRLQRDAVDLDTLIEDHVGDTIPNIFAQRGEEEFRQIETAILSESLGRSAILATGGGVVTQAQNRELLRVAVGGSGDGYNAHVIYLRARPVTLAQRIRLQPGVRPLIDGDGVLDLPATIARVTSLLESRSAYYEEVADIIIDTDGRSASQIVEEIVARLRRAGIGS